MESIVSVLVCVRVHRELEDLFNVEELPTVVVLRPDCSILIPNAVEEIIRLDQDCYRNDMNFMIIEDFEEKSMRRLKYKVEDNKNKKDNRCRGWGGGRIDVEVDAKDGGGST